MKLRAKIFIVTLAMMAILYALVVTALLPGLVDRRLRARMETGQASARALAVYLETLPHDARSRALQDRAHKVFSRSALGFWFIEDGEGRTVAWSESGPVPDRIGPEEREHRKARIEMPLAFGDKIEEAWILYARPAGSFSVGRELWTVFVVMFVGALMMGLAIYLLLLRLVVLPVERLASASRAAAGGRGALPRVPHTNRSDEVGDLMRSYNAMADEVNDLRLNLEQRVSQAISELEAAQKKLVMSERLSVTGKLAAGVAHEINNPLGGMLNAARSLQSKAPDDSRERRYAELMVEGLGRIQRIVSTMLQFARPTDLHGVANLVEVIDGALMFCQYRLSKNQITLEKDYPEDLADSARVIGNQAGLGQIFLNLVVNAIDAMETKGGGPHRLAIRLRKGDGQVAASVQDSGIGMSAEIQTQAGEPFYSTKSEGRGTGLGLAIVKHIIQEHNGVLDIDSKEGEGTCITVRLPEAEPTPAPSTEPAQETTSP